MDRLTAITLATALFAIATACSSDPTPVAEQQGALPAGEARMSVDGNPEVGTNNVACWPAGSMTTFTIGSDHEGATVVLDASQAVQTVSIRNLNGFTGSYNVGLGGHAMTTMTGRTYLVVGTAEGFAAVNPSSRTSESFAITVSC